MKRLQYPIYSTEEVFNTCIETIQDVNFKGRLENGLQFIVDAKDDYETKAPQTLLHTIKVSNTVNNNITKEEMTKVYNKLLKNKNARNYYDDMMNSVPHDLCPLCNQRIVDSMEHHLPKSKYPVFALTTINMFPACLSCNKKKSTFIPENLGEEPIHPYFDNFDDGIWLGAELKEIGSGIIDFTLLKPHTWSDIKFERMENHYEKFDIKKLYLSHSAVEYNSIKPHMEQLFRIRGANEVRFHLETAHKSKISQDINSWQSAFYSALLNSEWFINGGFF